MRSIKDYVTYAADKIKLSILFRTDPEAARKECIKPIIDLYSTDENFRNIANNAFAQVLKRKNK